MVRRARTWEGVMSGGKGFRRPHHQGSHAPRRGGSGEERSGTRVSGPLVRGGAERVVVVGGEKPKVLIINLPRANSGEERRQGPLRGIFVSVPRREGRGKAADERAVIASVLLP